MVLAGVMSYAQEAVSSCTRQVPAILSLAVKKGITYTPQVSVDFSFYNKNFTKVFGYYNYTSDNFDYGERNVYVGYNDKLYYNNNRPLILNMPQAGVDLSNINYNGCPEQFEIKVLSNKKKSR